jgi:hypothetical protein
MGMTPPQRLFIASGLLVLPLAAGFFFQVPHITQVFWPWPDGRLTHVFVASILAAIASPMLWIGMSGELAAARAGALNLTALSAPAAAYVLFLGVTRASPRLVLFGLAYALGAAVCVAIYRWSRGLAFRDRRPTPAPVRTSFALFTGLLVAVGVALVLRAPHVFPWPLQPDTSVLVGLSFLGAAVYFAAGLRLPLWATATGPLIAFLAYDAVLIGPFLAHFAAVRPEHRLSLIAYVAVLLYSGALAATFLWRLRSRRHLQPWVDSPPPAIIQRKQKKPPPPA